MVRSAARHRPRCARDFAQAPRLSLSVAGHGRGPWVYAGTTLLTIIAFGILTLFLHDDILRGDRAALALTAFIAVFWTARILVDFTYFSHSEWPAGPQFVAGHFLLTALFSAMALTYWAVLIWRLRLG